MLAPSREDGRIDNPGSNLRLCRIRNLDIMSQKVLDLDFLCSELSTQRGAIESGTKDSCFISIDVECNFAPGRMEAGSVLFKSPGKKLTHSPTSALTAFCTIGTREMPPARMTEVTSLCPERFN